jgi:hypothetical protein
MRPLARLKTRLFRRDAETSTRDACAPQNYANAREAIPRVVGGIVRASIRG